MTSNRSVYRSYGFWMSLSAAVLLVVQTVLQRLGIQIDKPFIQEIISAVLAVLVILGVIAKPKKQEKSTTPENIQPQENNSDENGYLTNKTIDKE